MKMLSVHVRTSMVGPVAALGLLLGGCSMFDSFSLQERSQPVAGQAATTQPQGRGINMPPTQAPQASKSAAPTELSLEDRIKEYVNRFPGGNTTNNLQERPSERLAQATDGTAVPKAAQPTPATPSPTPAPSVTRTPPAVPAPAQPAPEVQPQPTAAPPPTKPEPTSPVTIQPKQPTPAPQPTSPPVETPKPQAPRVESVEIRSNSGASVVLPEPVAQPKQAPPQPSQSTNKPMVSQPKPTASLSDVIASMEQALTAQPTNLADQFKLRLLYLLDGQEDKATAPAEGISNEMATVLGSLIKTVATVRNTAGDRNAVTDEALSALDEFRSVLRAHAELSIPRLTLCRRVDSYGVFEEIEPRSFPAGQSTPVILYCEVKNFTNEPTGTDEFQTVLSQRLEIFTKDGESQWEVEASNIEDRSRNRREDFFIAQIVHIPPTLKPGDYVLNVTVEDKLGAKSNEKKLEFTITAGQ